MGKNNKKTDANNQKIENSVNEETKQVTKEPIVMTDAEIAQKYHLDEHSWEGTVAIWKIKKELGIK